MTFDDYLAANGVTTPDSNAPEQEWLDYAELIEALQPAYEEEQRTSSRGRVMATLPEAWTRNIGAAHRALCSGMEIRLPGGRVCVVDSTSPAAAYVSSVEVAENGARAALSISLHSEVEYRRARAEPAEHHRRQRRAKLRSAEPVLPARKQRGVK